MSGSRVPDLAVAKSSTCAASSRLSRFYNATMVRAKFKDEHVFGQSPSHGTPLASPEASHDGMARAQTPTSNPTRLDSIRRPRPFGSPGTASDHTELTPLVAHREAQGRGRAHPRKVQRPHPRQFPLNPLIAVSHTHSSH